MNADLDRLRTTVENGNWFRRLGTFTSRDRFLAITNYEAWAGYTVLRVAGEFGLRTPTVAADQQLDVLQTMDYLPTDQTSEDPFHGSDLINRIKAENRSDLLKKWRLDLCKMALVGFRDVEPDRWLKVGATDYTGAAKQGLLFAIRMAVAEVVAEEPGIWCSCCDLFAAGHWPMGKLSGVVVVL